VLISHFGLRALPFSQETASTSLYATPGHQELLARLQFVIRQRAFGLVTGDVGAGKSTAVRALYDMLDRTVHPFLYIADSRLTPKAFYREVLEQLGLEVPFHARQIRRRYEEAILDAYRRDGRQPVLVLDEAHLLGEPMLQEIRFLLNFHMDSVAPLSLLLVGQPELRSKLRLKTFEAIVQRIQVRYHLTGLTEAEVVGYIEHHMRQVGSDHPIFAEQAIRAVAVHSRGIPRQINNLCTACLWDACARGQRFVEEANVQRVLTESLETDRSAVGSPW
jgi:general secretion pathway protein A